MAGSPSPTAIAKGADSPAATPPNADIKPLRKKPRRFSSKPLVLISAISSCERKCSGALTRRARLVGFSIAPISSALISICLLVMWFLI